MYVGLSIKSFLMLELNFKTSEYIIAFSKWLRNNGQEEYKSYICRDGSWTYEVTFKNKSNTFLAWLIWG